MELTEFFRLHPKAALGFSGGVDSAYLLYAATKAGAQVRAYYVQSAFQPAFELEDARRLAQTLSAELTVLTADVLSHKEITDNPPNRCYYCKKCIFSRIAQQAAADGFSLLLDGTNASDDAADRAGMAALTELSVLSPLRECGLTKAEIRRRSKAAGLFTWNKPSYACLATRIPAHQPITADKLRRTELAEDYLFSLGFSDFRVRMQGSDAKLQLPASQWELLLAHRSDILRKLGQYYTNVVLDLEVRDESIH